ncbi:DNA-binding transcriptional regulator, ArsR family [Nocardiopsis flavescens]|uniref:DNA-binding transcriptional regulator, ArsR family n=1 Tax=Nocardiopsis flavescens TaxID=758803 RepID=A0A1M6V8U3_9ACTN|nr:metalloregulator ArsR/SmtB family transcription factor [Nocardiopsis flavescens]SHK77927.1 DNA-binding transcriptional regulator, ArsR family [Nocardiopsis flavescens]
MSGRDSGGAATATVFAALGDPTRWEILVRLGRAPASASALAAELPVTRQAVGKHLEVLRAVGLVESSRSGREVLHRPVGSRLDELGRDLQRVAESWDRRLAAVKEIAERGD